MVTIAANRTVDRDELLDFVRPRHHGILVTTRGDGSPQLSPVTMGVDAVGRVVVSTYPERAKARNAAARSRGSVLVLSDSFSDDWVQLDGELEVVGGDEGIEALVDYFRAISGEHPDWQEYRNAMRRQGKVLLRLTIERWSPVSRGGFPPHLAPSD
jgi:PPOX class probable F420-dependent enzyme